MGVVVVGRGAKSDAPWGLRLRCWGQPACAHRQFCMPGASTGAIRAKCPQVHIQHPSHSLVRGRACACRANSGRSASPAIADSRASARHGDSTVGRWCFAGARRLRQNRIGQEASSASCMCVCVCAPLSLSVWACVRAVICGAQRLCSDSLAHHICCPVVVRPAPRLASCISILALQGCPSGAVRGVSCASPFCMAIGARRAGRLVPTDGGCHRSQSCGLVGSMADRPSACWLRSAVVDCGFRQTALGRIHIQERRSYVGAPHHASGIIGGVFSLAAPAHTPATNVDRMTFAHRLPLSTLRRMDTIGSAQVVGGG